MTNDDDSKCRAKLIHVMSKIAAKTGLSRQLVDTTFKMALPSTSTTSKESKDEKSDLMLQGKLQMIQIFAQAGKLDKQDISRTV